MSATPWSKDRIERFMELQRQSFIGNGHCCSACIYSDFIHPKLDENERVLCLGCMTYGSVSDHPKNSESHPRCLFDVFYCKRCKCYGNFHKHIVCCSRRKSFVNMLKERGAISLRPFASFKKSK